MRQLIMATVTLIVLTGVSSALALRSQLQPVTHCGEFVPYSPCRG
jgi:hypothetical protein